MLSLRPQHFVLGHGNRSPGTPRDNSTELSECKSAPPSIPTEIPHQSDHPLCINIAMDLEQAVWEAGSEDVRDGLQLRVGVEVDAKRNSKNCEPAAVEEKEAGRQSK